MKNIVLVVIILFVVAATSCGSNAYDVRDMTAIMAGLDGKVTRLVSTVAQLEKEIATLKVQMIAIEKVASTANQNVANVSTQNQADLRGLRSTLSDLSRVLANQSAVWAPREETHRQIIDMSTKVTDLINRTLSLEAQVRQNTATISGIINGSIVIPR